MFVLFLYCLTAIFCSFILFLFGFFCPLPTINNKYLHLFAALDEQVTATDGDKDRPQNIVYFLTGQGIDPDNPANSKFDINRTTGEIFVLKVSHQRKQNHYAPFVI